MPENIALLSSIDNLPFKNILCNRNNPCIRYIVLIILVTSMVIGNYYCYDYPVTVTAKKDKNDFLNTIFDQYIYYNAPNVISPILIGFLIDYFNEHKCSSILMSFTVLLGQLLFTIGSGFYPNVYIVNIGRFLLGLGGECLFLFQCIYVLICFEFSELSYMMSLIIAFDRIGSFLNYLTTPLLLPKLSTGLTLLFGCGFCLFSFIVTLIMFIYYQSITDSNKNLQLMNRERIRIVDLKQNLTMGFWLICLIYVFFYASYFQLLTVLDFMYKAKFNITTNYIYLIGAFFCLIIGALVNFIGFNLFWLLFGSIITIITYILLIVSSKSILLIGFLGLSYGIQACIMLPLIIYIVPIRIFGISLGILLAMQNIANLISNVVSKALLTKYGTFILMIYHIVLVVIQFYLILLLIYWDSGNENKLNKSSCRRRFEYHISSDEE